MFGFDLICGMLFGLGVLLAFILGLLIYFIPTFIAFKREHAHKIAILVLNLIAGGTGIGWVAAFIWAFVDNSSKENKSITQELKELAQHK